MRPWIWTIAVGGWGVVVVYALIHHEVQHAAALSLCAIGFWIVLGLVLARIYGIRRHVTAHFGRRIKNPQMIRHTVTHSERVDVARFLEELHKEQDAPNTLFGIGSGYQTDLTFLILNNQEPSAIEWDSVRVSTTEWRQCPSNALYLLRNGSTPFAALMAANEDQRRGGRFLLQILALSQEEAQSALNMILDGARESSIYRGRTLSLKKSDDPDESFAIRFHELSEIPRDRVILPESVMEVVERNVLSPLKHRETLQRSGRSSRRGILFHGPPGTGKTLLTKHIAGEYKDFTVILLTGWQLRLIRESFNLARFLSPSLIVMEDVDLIARSRKRNRHNTVLHELLDELDGLAPESECVVLMTTNRPEILEGALASRPGRVDQAIYFPLPDAECRRRLFELFGEQLDFASLDLDRWLSRTEGASPAFVEELVRKSVIFAAERGEESTPIRLTNDDFENAMRELVLAGGDLTRKLLGFHLEEDEPPGGSSPNPS